MDNVALVKVIDSIEHLSNRLRGVFLRELATFADSVEQLAAHREIGDNVEFVLVLVR